MAAPRLRFVLHATVCSKWWIRYSPHSAEALRFLDEELEQGKLSVAGLDGIHLQVLQSVAADLRGISLNPSISQMLHYDIDAEFAMLAAQGALRLIPQAQAEREAFILATFYGISFEDALPVVVAESGRLPLLVSDDKLYPLLSELEVERPNFRVVSMPDYRAFT